MRRACLLISGLLVLPLGCGRRTPAEEAPTLAPGDVVRPEVLFAPKSPWKAGGKLTIGVLARVERSGREARYLNDEEVPLGEAVTTARLTFFAGDRPLDTPSDYVVPHDC